MLHKKKKIVLYFKEDTIDSEKLQSTAPSLTSRERTVQASPSKKKKISRKGKGKRRRESANMREKEKKEEKGKEEKKKEEKMERAVLKVFFFLVHRPLQIHSLAQLRHRM